MQFSAKFYKFNKNKNEDEKRRNHKLCKIVWWLLVLLVWLVTDIVNVPLYYLTDNEGNVNDCAFDLTHFMHVLSTFRTFISNPNNP